MNYPQKEFFGFYSLDGNTVAVFFQYRKGEIYDKETLEERVKNLDCHIEKAALNRWPEKATVRLPSWLEPNASKIEITLRSALQRLTQAAEHRDNTQGDLNRLLMVQAELREAAKQGRKVLDKYKGD